MCNGFCNTSQQCSEIFSAPFPAVQYYTLPKSSKPFICVISFCISGNIVSIPSTTWVKTLWQEIGTGRLGMGGWYRNCKWRVGSSQDKFRWYAFSIFFWVLLLMTTTVSNGALFMPNTHFMQEVTRRSFDNYLDAVDNGQPQASPHYLRVSKGKRLLSTCQLYNNFD